jgi:V/A-type H+-transporting ATPase subunit E
MSSSFPADTSTRGKSGPGKTAGVQELIDRLKSEGVEEGQQAAESLLAEAKKQAVTVVDAAHTEADELVKAARLQVEQMEANGKRALALASRDTCLQLKEQLQHEFRGWVGRLVSEQLTAPEFLAELIFKMASQAIAANGDQPVSGNSTEADQMIFSVVGANAELIETFIKQEAAEMLRQGIHLQADHSLSHGFRVQLADREIELDFTDEAVTAALMRFLAPKFRQLIGSASEVA